LVWVSGFIWPFRLSWGRCLPSPLYGSIHYTLRGRGKSKINWP